jgi:hypothetical protein
MTDPKRRLDVLTVKAPCPESWDAMDGDDEVRFCGICRQNVYDLSAMTRDRAETLVFEREGRVCVRFYRRADGTVSTLDCAPIRFAALRKAAKKSLSLAAALVGSLLSLVVGLGFLRTSGFDLERWIDEGPIGKLARGTSELVEPEVMMGEPPMIEPPMIEPAHLPEGATLPESP